MESITGEIVRIIYRNNENGYTVLELTDESGEEIVAVGGLPHLSPGERVELSGRYTEHPSYGMQFKVSSSVSLAPASLSALEVYLASGLIKGVGAATAHSIVAHFGMDTFEVLENSPERLKELPGIGASKAKTIANSFFEQRAMRDIIIALQAYGITVKQAMKLYQLYGANCVHKIESEPYSLIEDVDGIGFKIADKIAANTGIEPASFQRLRAGLLYMMTFARNEGHTYLPKDILLTTTEELLDVREELIEEALDALIIEGALLYVDIEGVGAIYRPVMYYMEADCAKRLLALNTVPDKAVLDIKTELDMLQKSLSMTLAPQQRGAIEAALVEGAMVITGGPGTGKTTIIQFMLHILARLGLSFVLCAPTGRAAKRMTEATGFNAYTIHRLLEYGGMGQPVFARNEENPIYYDMVVVDEMSMVDLPLFYALLKALPSGTRLIMVGDADQLPPVGAGTVLHDIIKSDLLVVETLNEIYRQSGRSGIAINAQMINNGELPVASGEDFEFIPCDNTTKALEKTLSFFYDKSLSQDAYGDLQVLSPMKKGALGVYALNAKIQNSLNPKSPDKLEKEYGDTIFREGDKVMQIKNNYKLEWVKTGKDTAEAGTGAYNGDIGCIYKIHPYEQALDIIFDDERVARYTFNQLDELELAYCISIHKSQGSEFPVVILPLFTGPPMLMTRNLLYTAVTRARTKCIILGRWDCVAGMVDNRYKRKRYSALDVHLSSTSQLFSK